MVKTILGTGFATMDTLWSTKQLPKADSFAHLNSEELVPGGSCGNMLVAYANLGGNAKQIAKIGDDEFGVTYKQTLEADGVDSSLLKIKKGGTTHHTYIVAAKNGEHCIFSNIGDCLLDLQPEEIDDNIFDGIDIFYSDLTPCKATLRLAELAKAKGIPIVMSLQCTPSFMSEIGIEVEDIKKALTYADLFISGRDTYYEITGITDDHVKATEAFYKEYKPKHGCICTAGSTGSVWVNEAETIIAKAYEVTAIDSTGAGDSFIGALIYSLYELEENYQEAINFASAVGAMKCTIWGPRIKKSAAEVKEFMKEYE